ncbi:hypothetical protein GCM10020331_025670 [Ectobacillus funiculus]
MPESAAQEAWSDYKEGLFLPDMEHWANEPIWKPAHALVNGSMLVQLFSDAVNETLHMEALPSEGWEKKQKRLYNHREFSLKQLLAAANEEDWLRKIGYIEDDTPFTISLRLLEPHEDGEMWHLETVLVPKTGGKALICIRECRFAPKTLARP